MQASGRSSKTRTSRGTNKDKSKERKEHTQQQGECNTHGNKHAEGVGERVPGGGQDKAVWTQDFLDESETRFAVAFRPKSRESLETERGSNPYKKCEQAADTVLDATTDVHKNGDYAKTQDTVDE